MYAQQQINAFEIVKDLRLAIEIKICNKDNIYIVSAHEIENQLKNWMCINSEVRKKMNEMQQISKRVMIDGGSLHSSLDYFIENMMTNIP